MDETTILTAIRDLLRQDAQSGDLYQEHVRSIEVSEGGEIEAGTPVPAIAVEGADISYTPRTMVGTSERAVFNVIVHVYLDETDRNGPEPGSQTIKRLCKRVKTLLQRNKLGLKKLQLPLVGITTYPRYTQRTYIDRREGRVPITYKWVAQ